MQKSGHFDLSLSPKTTSKQIPKVLYGQSVLSYIIHPAKWNVNKPDRKIQQVSNTLFVTVNKLLLLLTELY